MHTTRYHLIYRDLRQRIFEGFHGVGERLPSVKSMMNDNGASQSTVMKALEMLANEGLVERRPGVGLFVARSGPVAPEPLQVGLDFYADELQKGIRSCDEIFTQCRVECCQTLSQSDDPEWPDVVTLFPMGTRDAVDRGRLMPLDAFLDRDSQIVERIVPEALDLYRHDGQLWALPIYWAPLAAHLNVDLFERAGVPIPSGDWGFEDLIETCRALAERGLTQPLAWTDQFHYHASFIFAQGGRLYDPETKALRLDSSEACRAFEGLRRLVAAANPPMRSSSETTNTFLAGKSPIFFWGMIRHAESLAFRHQVVPMPGRRNTVVTSSALAISRRTPDPERAWRLLRAMFSNEASQWTTQHDWQFPTTHASVMGVLRRHPELWPLYQRMGEVRPELYRLGSERMRVVRGILDEWWKAGVDLPERLCLAQKALAALDCKDSGSWEADLFQWPMKEMKG